MAILDRPARLRVGLCAYLGAGLALVTLQQNAQAQTTAQADNTVIEEIVVLSRRREEMIQEIPISVSAFTSADIERIAPRSLKDFDGLAPNVAIGHQTAGPNVGQIFVRGVGYADVEKTQSPAVGVMVDGVYQGTNTGQLIDMFDTEQMEINRGPQGVLFGKNTTGGSFVVNRVRPQFNEWGWTVSGEAGEDSLFVGKARVNVPLIDDTLAWKISGMYRERDGLYDNTFRGGSEGDIDYTTITTSLLFEPTESFSALLTYDHIDDSSDLEPQDPRFDGDNPFETQADIDSTIDYTVDSISLNAELDVGLGTISSITAYVDADDEVRQDFDGANLNAPSIPFVQLHTNRDQSYTQFSQELRLSGDFWGRQDLAYTVGGFYWDTETDLEQLTDNRQQLPNFLSPAPCAVFATVPGLAAFSNPNPTLGDALCQTGSLTGSQNSGEDVTSYAAFGALTWAATERLELHLGARYIYEEKDFDSIFQDADGNFVNDTPWSGDDDWDKTVFESSIRYSLNDNMSVYGRWAEGYRSGGFSIRATDQTRATFSPETVDSYEVGFKSDLLDNTLRFNVAAFYIEVSDPQYSSILVQQPHPGTNTMILNAKETENYGLEIETIWAATDNFSFRGTLGIQDGESKGFTESSLNVTFNPATGTGCNPVENAGVWPDCPDVAFDDSDISFAPDWNYSITAMYTRDIAGNPFDASISWREQDDFVLVGSATGVAVEEDGYGLLDANVSYLWRMRNDDTIRFSLMGKNLTDEEYLKHSLPLGADGGFQGWGLKRSVSFEVVWSH